MKRFNAQTCRTKDFRPRIPDTSKDIRKKFVSLQIKSGLTMEAFSRKMAETGLAVMERQLSQSER